MGKYGTIDRIHKWRARNYSSVFLLNHPHKPQFKAKLLFNSVCANEAN